MIKEDFLKYNYHLSKLARILNYQLTFGALVIVYLLMFTIQGTFFLLGIFLLASLTLTPYMLFVLYREKKRRWIYFFIILIPVPLITLFALFWFYDFSSALLFIPLLLFYLFCFLLRFSVNEWLREIQQKNFYNMQREKKEEELNEFMQKFE